MREIIDGSLLGDGHMTRYGEYSHCDNNLSFLKYLQTQLNLQSRIYIHPKYKRLISRDNKLRGYRDRWYKENVKIIPNDIKLTPITLFYWYLGDGNLDNSNKWYRIRLCTDCFELEQLVSLKNELEKVLNIQDDGSQFGEKIHIYKVNNRKSVGHRLYLNHRASKKFFNYVKNITIPDCYEYKFPIAHLQKVDKY